MKFKKKRLGIRAVPVPTLCSNLYSWYKMESVISVELNHTMMYLSRSNVALISSSVLPFLHSPPCTVNLRHQASQSLRFLLLSDLLRLFSVYVRLEEDSLVPGGIARRRLSSATWVRPVWWPPFDRLIKRPILSSPPFK